MLLLSVVSGVISSFLWIIGDILIVGFDTDVQKYGDFIEQMDGDMHSPYFLRGSERRLRFGALISNFSTPLVIFRYFSLFLVSSQSKFAVFLSLLFFISSTYYPMAHCSFYYVGTIFNYCYGKFLKKEEIEDIKPIVKGYKKMQLYSWMTAILLIGVSWLAYSILIFMGKTQLPQWMGFFSPVLCFFAFELFRKLPYPGKPLLNGAGFNVAEFIFFTVFLLWLL